MVDTQSIAQQINQIKRMLEDYGIQTDMLDKLVDQLAELEKQTSEPSEHLCGPDGEGRHSGPSWAARSTKCWTPR